MPFTFPDPQTTPEFTGDNGITYVWDADDSKWQVKGFAGEQGEDFDPQLKEHVCAEFFKVVPDYQTVEATKGHSMATYNFGDPGVKYWTKPPKAGFFVNGESYYIDEAGPFQLEQLDNTSSSSWVTFFIKGGPQPTVGGFCTFSKTRKLCTEINYLQNEIIELEEEIDAITPSVERGVWKFNLSGGISSRGQMTMTDGMNQSGTPIGLFKNAQSVWLNELDSTGTPHGFANVLPGDLIELFVEGKTDYGLFTVVEVHDETDGTHKYWVIDVEFVRSLDPESKVSAGENVRVKIVKPPTGGEADLFVKKTGDEMSGVLNLQDENNRGDYTLSGNKSYLKFTTKDSSGNEQTCALFQAGYSNSLMTSSEFMSGGNVYTRYSYCGGKATSDGFSSFPPHIRLDEDSGEIWYSQQPILTWNAEGVTLPNPSSSAVRVNSFTIMGKTGSSYNITANPTDEKLFYVSHYANEVDGIFYTGRITYDTHIATKKYVDDNVRPIQIVAGNPSSPQVGDAWFSTNQNVFIIKIS